ncbi:Fibronectin type III domain-containing protein [Streptomyces sp. DvalAA-14]|uniref:cellulose binding domain-containing protein n=1 Tax=unclassified Streptomyces TaxID=2593676 RepID=UPI00081B79F2|nr:MULTISPECIES: cellulose binding domain-containing protein [unclassified Streptomyces]MYS22819.1 cellulose-binding protein [Streptomyces sp. SID4948]SCE22827.1 Fibronectin type III domain-containing protein [Streptomyces sp. DvalAA-14]
MSRASLRAAMTAALVVGGMVTIAAPASHAADNTGLIASFGITSTWGTGFEGGYTVTNKSIHTVSSWTIAFTLPAGEAVTSSWNGTVTHSGTQYTITSPSWETPLAPGDSAPVVGLDFSYSGSVVQPAGCLINNGPCAGVPADTVAPSAPSGLAVRATGPGSVTLGWNASTDNVGVVGYQVYEGSSVIATTSGTGTTATVTGLLPGSSHSFSVTALDDSNNQSAHSATLTATAGTGTTPGVAAPFIDLGAYPTPNLTQIAMTTGLRQFSLGFITAGSTGCAASWFNSFDPGTAWDRADFDSLRAMGGDVRPSFGGEAGTELALACTNTTALQAQYQKVVDAYALDRVDFDIEGAAAADHASIDRRSTAVAAVQAAQRAKGRDLKVTLTLPVLPSGLTADGLYILNSAKSHGLNVDTVNLMAMDYGDSTAPNPSGKMGAYAIQAATSTRAQIATVWPNLTTAQTWAMLGLTPMLGQNDTTSEVFTIADAQQVLSFAQQNHLGELGFWDVTRDGNACNGSLNDCTNIPQTPYQFSKLFATYAG